MPLTAIGVRETVVLGASVAPEAKVEKEVQAAMEASSL
jgi:hypothetical protein